jgi:hypothetical protein
VEQLQRGPGVDHARIVGIAAGGDPAPMAEGGPETLAGSDDPSQRLVRLDQRGVDLRPPELFSGQKGVDALRDTRTDRL